MRGNELRSTTLGDLLISRCDAGNLRISRRSADHSVLPSEPRQIHDNTEILARRVVDQSYLCNNTCRCEWVLIHSVRPTARWSQMMNHMQVVGRSFSLRNKHKTMLSVYRVCVCVCVCVWSLGVVSLSVFLHSMIVLRTPLMRRSMLHL